MQAASLSSSRYGEKFNLIRLVESEQRAVYTASETRLKISVAISETDALAHPEYMSDAGTLSWDLAVKKDISYSVGYGASKLFRSLNLFQMFWHVHWTHHDPRNNHLHGWLKHQGRMYK